MATVTKGKTFANGETVTPAKIHQLVDSATVTNIVNADVSNTAAIALSKLATGALPTGITVASANILDGTIVNADISASAAIADTKLATISTAGKVSNSATTATNANTASAIVARDASGNFSAGTITANLTGNVTGNVTGNAATSTKLAIARTIALTGDVTGSATFDGSANASITATVADDSHNHTIANIDGLQTALDGKQAAGSYAASSHTHSAADITSGTLANARTTATSSNTASAIVARDASGNFSAGTITASLSGNASSASTWASARNLSLTGDVTATISSVNGSANVSAAATIANNIITNAKLRDSAALSVIGNATNATADPADIAAATDGHVLRRSGTTLGFGQIVAAGIANDAVTTDKILDANVTDAKINSLSFIKLTGNPYKDNCLCSTTAALTASYNNGSSGVGATLTNTGTIGALSIDGIGVSVNSRVLVKDQTNSAQNGIYVCTNAGSSTTAWVLTRATDADQSAEVRGAVVTIDRGTKNGGKFFTTSFASTGAIGTTNQFWYQIITNGDSKTVTNAMLDDGSVTYEKVTFPSNFPIQMVQAVKSDTQEVSESGNVWEDITGLSLTLTRLNPSASGKVRIQAVIHSSTNSSNHGIFFQILRGSTAIGIGAAAGNRLRATAQSHYPNSDYSQTSTTIDFIDNSPGASATVTYKIQARTYSTNKGWINRSNNDTDADGYIGRTISTLTLTELTP